MFGSSRKVLGVGMAGALALLGTMGSGVAGADASPSATEGSASAVFDWGYGYWGGGIDTTPRQVSVGFSVAGVGTAVVGTSADLGLGATCQANGSGTESLASGMGTVSLSCSTSATHLWVAAAAYTRVGLDTELTGTGTLSNYGGSTSVTVTLALHGTPALEVWAYPYAKSNGYTVVGGTLDAEGAAAHT